jgi:hypothetical protein
MFSVATIALRYLSLVVFLMTIVTSVASAIWFYGQFEG